VDLITLDNGRLRLVIVPTRGLGVLRVDLGELRLGWQSPVQEVVHPAFVQLPSRGGLGWLEGFSEWLVRCGLESCGAPGKDSFTTNTGATAEMDLPLHGKIANLPASEVTVVIDREPPHRLHVRGCVYERMFYGPQFELAVDISTEPGSDSFRVADTVTNLGGADQEFQLLYHINHGPPLLEAGARFLAPVRRVTPMNAHAAKDVERYNQYAGPTAGFVEQVYCLYPFGDAERRTVLLLQNAAADRAVSMRYTLDQLPWLTLWKCTNVLPEGYVTGIEPGTGFPHHRRVERRYGRVPRLGPGQRRPFVIDYALHAGGAAVRQVAEEIAALQGGQQVEIDRAPAVVE
jgi:hypothetical protein